MKMGRVVRWLFLNLPLPGGTLNALTRRAPTLLLRQSDLKYIRISKLDVA